MVTGYRPKQAQEKTKQRDENKPKYRKLTPVVQSLITANIRCEWSPDQIKGRLKSKGLSMVCATTIYGFIQQNKALDGDLHKHLRHRKRYKRRTGSAEARGQIVDRISIDERLSIVDDKSRLGDWEADTVVGKGHNENHNGLIRQYLPKGMALDKVTAKDIRGIQNKLNNRPRKLLGYKTPNEVYDAMRLTA